MHRYTSPNRTHVTVWKYSCLELFFKGNLLWDMRYTGLIIDKTQKPQSQLNSQATSILRKMWRVVFMIFHYRFTFTCIFFTCGAKGIKMILPLCIMWLRFSNYLIHFIISCFSFRNKTYLLKPMLAPRMLFLFLSIPLKSRFLIIHAGMQILVLWYN